LIAFAESEGLATKKSVSGMERPGVPPSLAQVTPRLSVAAAGTKTW
jgi:hypothetical protein